MCPKCKEQFELEFLKDNKAKCKKCETIFDAGIPAIW